MMQFETYQWEDHVPRKGGWKFNLALGALALGLIAAAMPHDFGEGEAVTWASAGPAATVDLPGLEAPARVMPAAFTGQAGGSTLCPGTYAGS